MFDRKVALGTVCKRAIDRARIGPGGPILARYFFVESQRLKKNRVKVGSKILSEKQFSRLLQLRTNPILRVPCVTH